MLKKVKQFFNKYNKSYVEEFENDHYTVYVSYKANPEENIEDVIKNTTPDKFNISICAKTDHDLDISASRIYRDDEIDEDSIMGILIARFMGEGKFYHSIFHAEGQWAYACQTLLDANELVKDRLPGYCLTKKMRY